MKNFLIIPLSFFVLIITGCTSPKYNYAPEVNNFSEPPIGSVNTVYVGDSLVSQGVKLSMEGIKVTAPAKISWAYTVTPGEFRKVGQDGDKAFYQPFGTTPGNVDKALIADMWQAVMVRTSTRELCVITVFSVAICDKNQPFEKITLSVAGDSSFQQALLYNGRVGNKINVGYRETSSNMARPAFNNDVEYDLSESKVLGYKGAKIEVMNATNQSITYKLLSNFR